MLEGPVEGVDAVVAGVEVSFTVIAGGTGLANHVDHDRPLGAVSSKIGSLHFDFGNHVAVDRGGGAAIAANINDVCAIHSEVAAAATEGRAVSYIPGSNRPAGRRNNAGIRNAVLDAATAERSKPRQRAYEF